MYHRIHRIICTVLVVLVIAGCSGSINPADPGVQYSPDNPFPELTAERSEQSGLSTHYLWGYYKVIVNENHTKYEILPERQVTDHWNVLSWMENGPCTNCFKLVGVTPSGNGTIYVDVQIHTCPK